jgi:heat-inducible transcriptional repressor
VLITIIDIPVMVNNLRQDLIIEAVVKEYIKHIKPVSSEKLVKKYNIKVSPATIRNDMAMLVKEGYLSKPHLSSGRVPTNKGYRRFVDSKISNRLINCRSEKYLTEDIGRFSSLLSNNFSLMTIIWREDNRIFLNGIKRIFAQNEFRYKENAEQLAEIIENSSDIFQKIFQLECFAGIFIGKESPIWNYENMSIIFRKAKFDSGVMGVIGIIGPTRMRYDLIWSFLE